MVANVFKDLVRIYMNRFILFLFNFWKPNFEILNCYNELKLIILFYYILDKIV